MHIRRLRLVGFKSFVEPTELMIEPGLTGVVGPNGCGKSNLLEALRWVMGEQSHKSMRAAAMDDVIFAGTSARPARGFAEVMISIDNSDRKAPAEFNDSDDIEITRRIERDQGSSYRINGLEARARDVKLLFEDAATGARSPALVRQGQVAELVNAKPEHRRRILEDAAGIAGLHSRRHEAELRLKASEANLARVADVMGGLDSQIANLKRQSRQAKRYKELSGLIRQAEALQQHLAWLQTTADVDAAEALQVDVLAALGAAALAETEAMNRELAASEALPALREAEVTRAAVLQRLSVERQLLADEEARARDRLADLNQRLIEARRDEAREAGLAEESREAAARLTEEREAFGDSPDQEPAGLIEARAEVERARAAEAAAEAELATMIGEISELNARRKQLQQSQANSDRELAALDRLIGEGDALLAGLADQNGEAVRELLASVESLAAEIADQDDLVVEQEQLLADKRQQHAEALREAAAERLAAERLNTEAETLRRLFRSGEEQGPAPVADKLKIERGFERAVAAALGDDLDVPLDAAAPHHWREIAAMGSDPELPAGCDALSRHVKGPAAVRRRLQQIGVVDDAAGDALQPTLRPGQRLVSRNGALWRWDGIVVRAGAPTAYALRLEQRNRLEALESETSAANQSADAKEQVLQQLRAEIDRIAAIEKNLKSRLSATRSALDRDRTALVAVERRQRDDALRRASVEEAQRQRQAARAAMVARRNDEAGEWARVGDTQQVETSFETASTNFAKLRRERSLAEVTIETLQREHLLRRQRLEAIVTEERRWLQRVKAAEQQLETIAARLTQLRVDAEAAESAPKLIAEKRSRLDDAVERAEVERRAAADALAIADAAAREAARVLKEAQAAHGEAREVKARVETRLESVRERRATLSRTIRETLEVTPEELAAIAGLSADAKLPSAADVDRQLARYREDRERLGGVNLRAEEELSELEATLGSLAKERADLEQAIARLRQAIGKLNAEGRRRLAEAFEQVNGHFQRLFTTLFGGGEARLELVDSDEPLEAGLEIVAKPPGKKPATLSLLSGGEQTLTALSLIFAVFLTNPSPICVLDEVDAPLDDSNVDRFCTLMEEMARTTATRFLVITHHPMTMSRMQRLFGVTMVEKGISQLVSVDLATAEEYREAS